MFRWRGSGKGRRQTINEKDLLQGEVNAAGHHLTHQIEELLDAIIASFAPARGLMAEVLIAIPDVRQIYTITVRPDTSAALYLRLRASESIAGNVFATGVPFAGDIHQESQTSRKSLVNGDVSHLYSTQSVLALALRHKGSVIGVLNIESPVVGVLSQDALARLQRGNLVTQLTDELAQIKQRPLSEQEIIEDQLGKLREKIAFAINPADMTETYYQVLRIAGQSVRPAGVSGGLILVRDAEQNLIQTAQEQRLFAVRAARIGAFDSELEWELQGKSIARRIMRNRKGEVIPYAQIDPDYRDSGTGLTETSELIVPLLDHDRDLAIGVIGLVASGKNAFNNDDLQNLEVVADSAQYAVRRSEEYRRAERQSDQLDAAKELLRQLAPLFQQNGTPTTNGIAATGGSTGTSHPSLTDAGTGSAAFSSELTMEKIGRVRSAVCTKILQLATSKTNSEHAAFVLAQTTEGQMTYLVIQEKLTHSPVRPDVPTRWLATDGISGAAYSQGITIVKNDVAAGAGPNFISYFEGVRSEVDAPLKIGDTVLGVLDIESNELDHFTSEHIQWTEFLAGQAAFALATIDRAVKTCIGLAMATVSQRFDEGIAQMQQETDLQQIRTRRNTLLGELAQTLLPLTNSAVVRVLIALNAYHADGTTVDLQRGRLSYLVSTDPGDLANPDERFFKLTQGVSGKAFAERRKIVFNDLQSRPEVYFKTNPDLDCPAGIFVPVREGTQISGILDIESKQVGAFTPDIIQACQMASDLASKLVTAARLRILGVLHQQLRTFEIEILKQQSANLSQFMRQLLDRAGVLSAITQGWGEVLELSPAAVAGSFVVDRRYSTTYAAGGNQHALDETSHPVLAYPVFQEALLNKQPVLVLDRQQQPAEEHVGDPWPKAARSTICVPLLRPSDDGGPDELEAVGILALAHPNPAEFSEFDKEILTLFSEAVVVGLKNIALLQARKELMEQVRHNFSIGLGPLGLRMMVLKMGLDSARISSDPAVLRQEIEDIGSATGQIERSVYLFNALVSWFTDFSDDDLEPEASSDVMDARVVVQAMRDPIEVLADANGGRALNWDLPPNSVAIPSGRNRAKLIQAALFQYLDNAIKHGEKDHPITIAAEQKGTEVLFTVSSSNDPLPPEEWEKIFRLYYRGSNVVGRTSGSGIGLFQVREIAERLGGSAYYRPAAGRLNVFYLTVPAFDVASGAVGAHSHA